ncbi:MAG: hypothetical protein ABI333_19575 [bacterium]
MSGSSSLQALLQAAGMSGSSGSSGGGSNLPARLSFGQIRTGVYRIIGTARACYNRYRVAGTCTVKVTVSGASGRVSGAQVLGKFAGTPTGRCLSRAFKRARFPKFSSGSQSFRFPIRLSGK